MPREPPAPPSYAIRERGSLTFQSGRRSAPAQGSSAHEGLAALDFLTNLAIDLSQGPVELPCFPNVVIKIRDALNNPRTSPEEVVKLVGTEPRFAARLLQLANSAAYNASGRRTVELRTAIARLGQQFVQGAAMSFAVRHMKDEPTLRTIAKPLDELWQESIAVASLCKLVARRTTIKPDEAFLAGLFHGIGRLYIMAHSVGKSQAVNNELLNSDLIAGWHPSIGKAVLENWDMGEEMAQAIESQFDYQRKVLAEADLTDILIASIALAHQLKNADADASWLLGINSFKTLGMSSDDCATTMRHAELHLGALQEALGL
jgi:HD-like signal output (HDOD) protein